ncbi:MAG: bile acid:sodium symporter family protein [Planctomycetaceae bacterium]
METINRIEVSDHTRVTFQTKGKAMQRAGQFLQQTLLAWLIVFSAAALFWDRMEQPDPFLWTADVQLPAAFDPVQITGTSRPLLGIMIQLTMFCIGCLISAREIQDVFRRWPLVLGGTVIQYTSMPLLAWGLGTFLGLPRDYLIGVIVVGCVPGAMASNVLTLASRGNVSYSVSLTTSATILSPIIVPIAFQLTLSTIIETDPLADALKLLKQVVGPVILGHLVCRFSARAARGMAAIAPILANCTIIWVIAVVVALNRERLLDVFRGASDGSGLLLITLLLINLLGYAAGFYGGWLLKLNTGMRRALTLEVGMQNAGLGTVLVLGMSNVDKAAAIPTAVYTFGCMLTGTVLAQLWGRSTAQTDGKIGGSD